MVRNLMPSCAMLAAAFLALFVPAVSHAELKVDITKGVVEPMPIAIAPFQGRSAEETQQGRQVSDVVTADLERSGLFRPIDPKAFIQSPDAMDALPRFGDWRLLKAQALVQGRATFLEDGRLRIEFRLWDVYAEQQMTGFAFTSVPANWRGLAHNVADAIYKRLTGEDGYFYTRVVYIAESGPGNKRIKKLAIMDQDGANHRFLTDGNHLVLTPRFSPSLQEITYLSYFGGVPRVYIFNIDSGRQEILGDFPGMTFAPRFSPDSRSVIMSMARDGNTEIYSMNLATREVRRLTDHPSIDTSPCYSPDGKQIVFNSDRSGGQQLYIMNADGSNARRISFGEGRYATPVWSPRGDLIAFTKIHQGRFYIGVMRVDGSGERSLAEDFLVEAPTWAPNGRVLMFFKQGGPRADRREQPTRIFTIDLTGRNEREVVTPMDASDPAWSPLIP